MPERYMARLVRAAAMIVCAHVQDRVAILIGMKIMRSGDCVVDC